MGKGDTARAMVPSEPSRTCPVSAFYQRCTADQQMAIRVVLLSFRP